MPDYCAPGDRLHGALEMLEDAVGRPNGLREDVLCADECRLVEVMLELNGPTSWLEARVSLVDGWAETIAYVTTAVPGDDHREARFNLEGEDFRRAERILVELGRTRDGDGRLMMRPVKLGPAETVPT